MQQFGASKSGDLTSELTYYMQRWTRKHCCYVSLATDDDYSHHQNSSTCHQLAQSVLKMGSALAEMVGCGEVGGWVSSRG